MAFAVTAVMATAGTALAADGWSAPEQVDQAGTAVAGADLVTCPSQSLCFGANADNADGGANYGNPIVFHVPAAGASGSVLSFGLTIPYGSGDNYVNLVDIQCPTVSLCVGVADYSSDSDDEGGYDIVASTTPAAGPSSWIEENLNNPPVQLSCPTAELCVGAGTGGNVVTSQAPASRAWQSTKVGAAIVAVDCPSAVFCAAIDSAGSVWTSTDPTGGPGAWVQSGTTKPLAAAASNAAQSDGSGDPVPESLSCSGPSLCVAAGSSGTVLVSTDPGGAAAWTAYTVSTQTVTAVECVPAAAECLAGDDQGDISTSEGSAASTWTSVPTEFGKAAGGGSYAGVGSLSCTAERCVASPLNGTSPPLFASVPSGAGPWQWTALTVTTHNPLLGIACPAANDCVGADQKRYIASANPQRGAGSWHSQTDDGQYGDHQATTLGISCYSANGCLSVTDDGGLADVAAADLTRFDPAGGVHALGLLKVGGGSSVLFVTCAQGTCVTGYPSPGYWYESRDPASLSSWHKVKEPRFDVTCLKGNGSCVALADGPFPGTAGPDLLVAPRRSGPWRSQTLDPGGQITGLACTSARACVVVDAAGRLLVSTDPTAGRATWKLKDTDAYGFNGVACQDTRTCIAVDNNGAVVIGRP